MDQKEIDQIFYRDGFRLALQYLEKEFTADSLSRAITALYEAVDPLLEALLQRSAAEGKPGACKKGCAWCCHQEVFAVTHEFLFLNEYVEQNLDEAEQDRVLDMARDKVKISMNKSVEEQMKIRAACPFLHEGSCIAYEARPMACRIYLSSSEASCRKAHDNPDGKGLVALFDFPLRAGRMLNEGFVGYLRQRGLESSELPIEQGYSSLRTMGQSMDDWVSQGK